MGKTLRVAFPVAETGFDPQVTSDIYSSAIIGAIVEPLYVYDYFARPVRMVPNTAAALPEVTDEGRTYTIKVKPGIYFAADPAFKGKRRELTAEDYVYSIKRIFDPKVRSYWVYVFEGNLIGLDEALPAARKSGVLDYDAKIEGLQALDRYTLRIKFQAAELRIRMVAHDRLFRRGGARSRRRLQGQLQPRHGESGGNGRLPAEELDARAAHRAGGQSRLPRRQRFRRQARAARLPMRRSPRDSSGRKLPMVGNIDISIIEEAQPALLSFDSGKFDYVRGPADARVQCPRRRRAQARSSRSAASLSTANSRPRFRCSTSISTIRSSAATRRRKSRCGARSAWATTARRAIAQICEWPGAWPRTSQCRHRCTVTTRNTSRLTATIRAPRARCSTGSGTRTATATAIRELPDGKPLTLVLASTTDNVSRTRDELWKRNMDALGIRITFLKNKWPELNRMSEAGQLMMWGFGWTSNVPEGIDFYSYFYSKNIGTSNDARMRLPAFDALYEKSRNLPHSPQRTALFDEMNNMIFNYAPWIMTDYPYDNYPGAAVGQGLQAQYLRAAAVAATWTSTGRP